jgi:hypothetical protein
VNQPRQPKMPRLLDYLSSTCQDLWRFALLIEWLDDRQTHLQVRRGIVCHAIRASKARSRAAGRTMAPRRREHLYRLRRRKLSFRRRGPTPVRLLTINMTRSPPRMVGRS